jgi:predicted dehydrogenase
VTAKPLGFGIIGTGRMATDFARELKLVDGAKLQAVVSTELGKAKLFTRMHGAGNACGDLDELLGDASVDVVYVASPNHLHVEHSLAAIANGKAVLCEKPMSLDGAGARLVAERARAAGVFFMEGIWTHCLPAFKEARRAVEDGRIGRPRHLHSEFVLPLRRERGALAFDPELGGGALLDRGVYAIATSLALLGGPAVVQGASLTGPTGTDELASILMVCNDAVATMTVGFTHVGRNSLRLSGTAGWLEVESLVRPLTVTIKAVNTGQVDRRRRIPSFDLRPGRARRWLGRLPTDLLTYSLTSSGVDTNRHSYSGIGYAYEIEEVVTCIRDDKAESDLVPIDQSVAVMELIDEIKSHGISRPFS